MNEVLTELGRGRRPRSDTKPAWSAWDVYMLMQKPHHTDSLRESDDQSRNVVAKNFARKPIANYFR